MQEAVSYTTRIVVRRPADAARFTGTVHIEPFHVLGENAPTWGVAGDAIMRRGDAWIGVTVNSGVFGGYDRIAMPGGVALLQDAEPERYAPLSLYRAGDDDVAALADVPMTDSRRMMERITLAIAQGNDMAGQVATLARAGPSAGPFDDVARIYASGWSQTGMFWRAFVQDGRHAECRLPDGGPIVDAYVVSVAPGPDAHPGDAVVVNMLSEGEVAGVGFGAARERRARHRGSPVPRLRDPGDVPQLVEPRCAARRRPRRPQRSPVVPALPLARGQPRRVGTARRADAHGAPHHAAIGRQPTASPATATGTRSAACAHRGSMCPPARYAPTCACHPLTGEMVPFDADTIAARYGSVAAYLEEFDAAVDALVGRRWLRADDAGFVKEQAREEVGVR